MESTPQSVFAHACPSAFDSRPATTTATPPLGATRSLSTERLEFEDFDAAISLEGLGGSMNPVPLIETPAINSSASIVHMRNMACATSSIFSADYEAFAPRQSNMEISSRQKMYMSPSIPTGSHAQSCLKLSRSSLSPVASLEPHTSQGSLCSIFPCLKAGDKVNWPTDTVSTMTVTAPQECAFLSSAPFQSFSFGPISFGLPESMVWPERDTYGESTSMNVTEGGSVQVSQQRRVTPGRSSRTRNVRKMTTREDANFQCTAKGCGKLFSRSCNFKAHMETHDTGRVHPFACPLPDCDKKFVRKTDLQRHHQSVHMKERNFQCEYCSRLFARKDTLRRHMEDGCSRRFDLDVAFGPSEQRDPEKKPTTTGPIHNAYVSRSSIEPAAWSPSPVHIWQPGIEGRAGGNDTSNNVYQNSAMLDSRWGLRR